MPPDAGFEAQPQNLRLVIGGNRGIGFALVKAQLENPEVSRVIATHRPAADLAALSMLGQKHGAKLQ